MSKSNRTTITIDTEFKNKVKAHAALQGLTLTDFVNQAIEVAMRETATQMTEFTQGAGI